MVVRQQWTMVFIPLLSRDEDTACALCRRLRVAERQAGLAGTQGLDVQDICGRPCCADQHRANPGAEQSFICQLTFIDEIVTGKHCHDRPPCSSLVVFLQKHPWFRKGLPPNLEVDTYNGHYVSLSKQAVDNAGKYLYAFVWHVAAIKSEATMLLVSMPWTGEAAMPFMLAWWYMQMQSAEWCARLSTRGVSGEAYLVT